MICKASEFLTLLINKQYSLILRKGHILVNGGEQIKSITLDCLFLLLGLGLSLIPDSLLTDTLVSSLGASLTKSTVSLEGLALLGDGTGSRLGGGLDNGEDSGGGNLGSGSNLLSRSTLSGEKDQLALVVLETGNVGLKTLNGAVLATGVDGNTDGESLLLGNASSLKLLQGETSTSTDLAVVLDSGSTDNGSEQLKRARSNESGLLGSGSASAHLLTSLVEVSAHTLLPVLSEMVLLKGVVLSNGYNCVSMIITSKVITNV